MRGRMRRGDCVPMYQRVRSSALYPQEIRSEVMGKDTGVGTFTHCSLCGKDLIRGHHLYNIENIDHFSFWKPICPSCWLKKHGN